ncbi:MAG TPA: hypothetical protein VGO11_26425 [Chthoniobacteraceae bacterium]|jgi:hypothetical protein|nr:hypothetical protein [Chthoniobacteraceae bacterium]
MPTETTVLAIIPHGDTHLHPPTGSSPTRYWPRPRRPEAARPGWEAPLQRLEGRLATLEERLARREAHLSRSEEEREPLDERLAHQGMHLRQPEGKPAHLEARLPELEGRLPRR